MRSEDLTRSPWTGEFWRGRNVLVTGHTGFKGAWLSLWLWSLGARVTGFSLAPPTSPNLYEAGGLSGCVDHLHGDVRDVEAIRSALARSRPQIVLHLAAQALVRESYEDPLGTFATNVMGVANLLHAARLHNLELGESDRVRGVLIVTSDKCYENREWPWAYRENDPMGGYDPYSASKGCAEIVTASMRRAFGSGAGAPLVASARAGNVIGGGDWAKDRLVPDALRAFEAGELLVIRNPDATRPWQHVLEPLCGYLMLAERLVLGGEAFAEGWNFGPDPDSEKPVRHVVEGLIKHWKDNARWSPDTRPQVHEANFLKLDSSMARARLGWRPRLSLDEALAMTVEWRRSAAAARDPEAIRMLTLSQIQDYAGRCAPPVVARSTATQPHVAIS